LKSQFQTTDGKQRPLSSIFEEISEYQDGMGGKTERIKDQLTVHYYQ
jgi:hypothetical protein